MLVRHIHIIMVGHFFLHLHDDLVVGHFFLRQRHRFTVVVPDDEPDDDDPPIEPIIFLSKNGSGSAMASASASA